MRGPSLPQSCSAAVNQCWDVSVPCAELSSSPWLHPWRTSRCHGALGLEQGLMAQLRCAEPLEHTALLEHSGNEVFPGSKSLSFPEKHWCKITHIALSYSRFYSYEWCIFQLFIFPSLLLLYSTLHQWSTTLFRTFNFEISQNISVISMCWSNFLLSGVFWEF